MTNSNPKRIGLLRTAWLILVCITYTGVSCIKSIYMGMRHKNPQRKWVDAEIYRWSVRMLKLLKIRCKVYNPHGVSPQPGKKTIIMCNHASLFDIPIGFQAFPHQTIRMLAKKEMAYIPLMKYGMNAAEFPMINRHKRAQAIRDLQKVITLMESGIIMWIFPEGTRSSNGLLGPLKKGGFITAIQTGATIIPLGIRGAYDVLPARSTRFNLNQDVEIHVGEAIDASVYSLEDKDALIKTVEQSLVALTGQKPN
jgi:1-acyl-sn-glycerol-3-phosphate acyltransferase